MAGAERRQSNLRWTDSESVVSSTGLRGQLSSVRYSVFRKQTDSENQLLNTEHWYSRQDLNLQSPRSHRGVLAIWTTGVFFESVRGRGLEPLDILPALYRPLLRRQLREYLAIESGTG